MTYIVNSFFAFIVILVGAASTFISFRYARIAARHISDDDQERYDSLNNKNETLQKRLKTIHISKKTL